MKKILLTVCILMFAMLGADAIMMNGYGYNRGYYNGGYYNNGYVNRINTYSNSNAKFNNYGSNAAFSQQNIQRAIDNSRRMEFEKRYFDNLENSQNINVNIRHTGGPGLNPPPPPPNDVYNNGYYNYNRYYNGGYYNSSGFRYPNNGIYYNGGNGIRIPGVRMF